MKYLLAALCAISLHSASAQVSGYKYKPEQGQYSSITDPVYANAIIREHNLQDDYASPVKVALPFPFRFAGQLVDSVGVHANGYIWFGPAGWGGLTNKWPLSAQHPSSVRGVVSPVGADLHPVAGSKLRTGYTGTAPFRIFFVEWEAMSREETWISQPDTLTFQIKLYESYHRVEINYGRCALQGNAGTPIEVGIRGARYDDYHTRIFYGSWAASSRGTSQSQRSILSDVSRPGSGQILAWEAWQEPAGVGSAATGGEEIRLYPQPAQDRLQISLPGGEAGFRWKISDLTGRQLQRGDNAAGSNSIAVLALPPGTYVLELQRGSKTMRARFVKS